MGLCQRRHASTQHSVSPQRVDPVVRETEHVLQHFVGMLPQTGSRLGQAGRRLLEPVGRTVIVEHSHFPVRQWPEMPPSPQEAVFEKIRPLQGHAGRSEEHTSELQSLMRLSYAVFCLKKKNNK